MDIKTKAKNIFEWSFYHFGICKRIEKNPKIMNLKVPRYSVYTCHLGENIGDEKNGYGRPVIVLSSSIVFEKNSNVIIAPLSKNIKWEHLNSGRKKLKFAYHYVLYKAKYPQLDYDSCIQFEDMRVISKARLGKYICKVVDSADINNVQKRVREIFGI